MSVKQAKTITVNETIQRVKQGDKIAICDYLRNSFPDDVADDTNSEVYFTFLELFEDYNN